MPAVIRVDQDGVDSRLVVAAAEPTSSLGLVPQRVVEPPGLTAIVAAKEAAGYGSGPEHARPVGAAGLEAPDLLHGGRVFLRSNVLSRRLGIRGCFDLVKGLAGIERTVQLHSEVPEVQCRVERSVAAVGKDVADRVADECRSRDLPLPSSVPLVKEKSLSRPQIQPVTHVQPPDKACMTKTSW